RRHGRADRGGAAGDLGAAQPGELLLCAERHRRRSARGGAGDQARRDGRGGLPADAARRGDDRFRRRRRRGPRTGDLLRHPAGPVRRGIGRGRRRLAAHRRDFRRDQPAGQARRELHAARARGHGRRRAARGRGGNRMIAEFGLAALWLAAALAGLQLLGGFAGLRPGGERLAALVRPAAVLQALLCALAFVALLWLFARTDLSVALVAKNSHSMKPLIFKLSGAWGNHEGSMLLWVSVMALAGGLIALVERRLPERTMLATLGAQAFVGLGFYAFLLTSSNPFERLPQPPAAGMGLNPLLQDIGLAMHPPTLYFGYVGLSVAFSFAVGALLTRQVTPEFARVMRPWILGAWIFLTLGITAGSYWAYYELGWGGWWFWDPVENASLMPWLAATALLHSASVLAARDALRTWTILLGVVAFSMSMVGTFL